MTNYERNENFHRARYALKCVERINDDRKIRKKYASYINSAGTLIQSAGLLQTLTFYCSKIGEKEDDRKKNRYFSYLVVDMLYYSLMDRKEPYISETEPSEKAWSLYRHLLTKTTQAADLMYYTEKTREIVRWLQRFTKGMIDSENDTEHNDGER